MTPPKITPKLFLAMYAVILLPLLVLNILVSQWNLDRVTDREEKQIQAKLDKISVELTELHATYNSKATQIYSKSVLSYRNMVGNFATAQAGADLLKDLAILDDRTCDFYMYYHTAEMFAARGYSHTDVFFGSQLLADKDTFDSAMTAIDAESPVAFLVNRKDYTNSYMIYHYPVTFGDQAGITATGFVFPLNTVMESFPDVIDLPYILRISDSAAGASYRLAGGHASPLTPAQYESAKKTKADWQYYKSCNESLGLTMELLYPYEAIATETRESQYWNYGLLLLGTICSAVLALILARISWKKLKEMEDFANGKTDVKFPKRFDEYSGLREILRARMEEFAASREYAKLTKIDNKAQLMRLLLAGMFTSQAEFSDAAKRCGLMMLQTHYFVIGVLVPNPDAMSQLDTLLEHDLTCHITVGESETPAMLLVAELSSEDFALSERIRLSNELKDVMHDHNLPIVQLAFSAVYDALDMAPFAVREVRDVLTRQSATLATTDELCAAEAEPMEPVKLLETSEATLRQLAKALQAQNEPDTMDTMTRLMKPVAVATVPPDSRRYMRYAIQQALVRHLRGASFAERDRLLAAALALDPADGARFDQLATRLAQRYCRSAAGVADQVKRVIQYIEQNFADPNASADTVADYVGLNKAYLTRIFKQKTGFSYMDLLGRLRMEQAMILLKDPTLSVTEVVAAVGYVDESSFRRKFRSVYGVSITEFRAGKKPDIFF